MMRLLEMLTVAHARGNTLEFTIPARRAQSFMGMCFTSSGTAQEMGRFVICENRYKLSSRYKIGLAHKTEPMAFGVETFYISDLESLIKACAGPEDFAVHEVPMSIDNMKYRVDPLHDAFDARLTEELMRLPAAARAMLIYLGGETYTYEHLRTKERPDFCSKQMARLLVNRYWVSLEREGRYQITSMGEKALAQLQIQARKSDDAFLTLLTVAQARLKEEVEAHQAALDAEEVEA